MKKFNKVFLMLQLGSPFEWNQQFIDHVQHLEQYGWYFKLFTSNKLESKGNVEIINIDVEDFNTLVWDKTGIRPTLRILKDGRPSFHTTDFIVTLGKIFEDYTKGFEFWGHVGFDNVIGRLDHFMSDSFLKNCDIFADDTGFMNGNFCLFRNTEKINNLFKQIPDWQKIFSQPDCPACLGKQYRHTIICPDEIAFNDLMPEFIKQGVRFKTPQYFPFHSHDRLEIHQPFPKLKIENDGSLWELIKDVNHPDWKLGHDFFGREISSFHFQRTKKYPL